MIVRGPSGNGPLVASRARLREDGAGARHRGRHGFTRRRDGRARHPRHRKHGRLRARSAIPGARDPMGRHRRAPAGDRAVGRDRPQPPAVAFQFSRAGRRTAGCGPRTHLPRPFLERTLRQSEGDRRGDPEPLRRALRATRRHALGVQPVRRLRARRRRQPSACGGGLARHAGAGAGRRPFVRRPDGRHHAGGRVERDSRRHPSVRPLGHGGTAGPDDCRDPGIRRSRMRATPRPFVLPAAGRATAPGCPASPAGRRSPRPAPGTRRR